MRSAAFCAVDTEGQTVGRAQVSAALEWALSLSRGDGRAGDAWQRDNLSSSMNSNRIPDANVSAGIECFAR